MPVTQPEEPNLDLPNWFRDSRAIVYRQLSKIRAQHLRERNLTSAIEHVCDFVVAQWRLSGKALTEEFLNTHIADATVSLALQAKLHATNTGPYTGESAVYRGAVKSTTSPDFDFRIRLRDKLNRLLADELDRVTDESRPTPVKPGTISGDASFARPSTKCGNRVYPIKYPDGTETPRGLLNRRRIRRHLKIDELHELVEHLWLSKERDRRKQMGLPEKTGDGGGSGFSKALLQQIQRQVNLSQTRLEVVAEALTDDRETVVWNQLLWREGFLLGSKG